MLCMISFYVRIVVGCCRDSFHLDTVTLHLEAPLRSDPVVLDDRGGNSPMGKVKGPES